MTIKTIVLPALLAFATISSPAYRANDQAENRGDTRREAASREDARLAARGERDLRDNRIRDARGERDFRDARLAARDLRDNRFTRSV
jgi:hypothetical protein